MFQKTAKYVILNGIIFQKCTININKGSIDEWKRELNLYSSVDVLHSFELVEVLCGGDVAAIDFVDRLPKQVGGNEIVFGQVELHLRREEPSPQRQTRRRSRTVVLNVDVVRDFVHLQFAF